MMSICITTTVTDPWWCVLIPCFLNDVFCWGLRAVTDSVSRKLDLSQLLEVAETKPLLSWAKAGLVDFVLRLTLSCIPWCKHCVLDFLQARREKEMQLSQAWSRLEGHSHKSIGCVCLKGTGRIFLAALLSAVIYISVMDKCRYFVTQSWTHSFRVKKQIKPSMVSWPPVKKPQTIKFYLDRGLASISTGQLTWIAPVTNHLQGFHKDKVYKSRTQHLSCHPWYQHFRICLWWTSQWLWLINP